MSKKLTTEEFVQKARQVHGDKYDYSKVEYINNHTKICIICPIHGEFWQTPYKHICRKHGCPKCGIEKNHKSLRLTTEEFIVKAREVHGDKYDYSKVEYINNRTKICIVCPIHGEFWQTPGSHLQGQGCSMCANIQKSLSKQITREQFLERAIKKHGDKYDYSKVNYIDSQTKVCIICPIHGEFWQTPNNHLRGRGCSQCSSSHLENEMRLYLNDNNIIFEEQKPFEWLKNGRGQQKLDFYLPQYNYAIECQGMQHFKKVSIFRNALDEIQTLDSRKRKLCEEHNIRLLYYSNLHINYPYQVFEDKEKLLEEIKKG